MDAETKPQYGCAVCARSQRTCCQSSEPFASIGDISRINLYMHRNMKGSRVAPWWWWGWREPSQEYIEGMRADPQWATLLPMKSGLRRVVLSSDNGNCVFLKSTGCVLPMEVKPLVCRIYPWDFVAFKVTGLSDFCAIEAKGNHRDMGEALGLTKEMAQEWVEQLRSEMEREGRL